MAKSFIHLLTNSKLQKMVQVVDGLDATACLMKKQEPKPSCL